MSSWGVHSKHTRHIASYAALGGSLLMAGYVAYLNDFNAEGLALKARESWRNLWETTPGDPNVEDLQKALGPPPPEHYLNVILAVEDVLLLRDWDVRGGHFARDAPLPFLRGRVPSLRPLPRPPPPPPHTHPHLPTPCSGGMGTRCSPARAWLICCACWWTPPRASL